jgi:hypothetical protein
MATVKDLSSQEWYHGPITRQNAVTLLYSEGDFIVRDCISNPGDYGMIKTKTRQVMYLLFLVFLMF